MRLAGIVRDSIVDGVGIRDVVFLQGCPHHCKGCHNPQTWSKEGGSEVTVLGIYYSLIDSSNDVTISGGEPFDQLDKLVTLCQLFNNRGKSIWIYTGYTFDKLPYSKLIELANNGVEVIVDGRFEIDKKDPDLLFRGSSNQRIIDLQKTINCNEVVLWEDS